jgi:GMP synthase (glutamine-hydrolysing)
MRAGRVTRPKRRYRIETESQWRARPLHEEVRLDLPHRPEPESAVELDRARVDLQHPESHGEPRVGRLVDQSSHACLTDAPALVIGQDEDLLHKQGFRGPDDGQHADIRARHLDQAEVTGLKALLVKSALLRLVPSPDAVDVRPKRRLLRLIGELRVARRGRPQNRNVQPIAPGHQNALRAGAPDRTQPGRIQNRFGLDGFLIPIPVVTNDEASARRYRSVVLAPDELRPIPWRDVLDTRPDEVVSAPRLPLERIGHLERVHVIGMPNPRQRDQFGHEVDAVRAQEMATLPRPLDEALEKKTVRTSDIHEVAVPVHGLDETAASFLPAPSPTRATGLPVGVVRFGQVGLRDGRPERVEPHVPGCVLGKRFPAPYRRPVSIRCRSHAEILPRVWWRGQADEEDHTDRQKTGLAGECRDRLPRSSAPRTMTPGRHVRRETRMDGLRFVEDCIGEIRDTVGSEVAINALSGGVDSSVCTVLGHRALGENHRAFFIDNALMREGEPDRVVSAFHDLDIPVEIVDARREFLGALEGLTDPEEKRQAITDTFYEGIFAKLVKETGARYLIHGTILTDIEETVAGIKRQHNILTQIGIDPEEAYGYGVLEPLRTLRKDGVREVARALELPPEITERIPFPGPALATRIVGEVTEDRLTTVRAATSIVEEELAECGAFQYMAVLLEDRATGIRHGKREFGNIIVLRCIESVDARTATATRLPWDTLESICSRVVEIPGVNRCVYDLTPKPPATVEYI